MKKLKLRKVIANTLVVASILTISPIGVSAEWKQDNQGWWNTEGSSWSVGWKEIDGKYYYFNSNGYMVHDTTIDGYSLGSDGTWIQNNTSTEGNQNVNSDSFDVNVSLKHKISIDDKIKGVNTNIIKATRQAIYDADCDFARLQHYNGYSVNNDVFIFDVKEEGTGIWEVDFYEKKSDDKEYDTIGYSFAIVEKQKDGSYKGRIIHTSPCMLVGETY